MSQSCGSRPLRRARTPPPTRYASKPPARSESQSASTARGTESGKDSTPLETGRGRVSPVASVVIISVSENKYFHAYLVAAAVSNGVHSCIVARALYLSDSACRLGCHRSRGETDITAVFGTAIPGSNPGGGTWQKKRPASLFPPPVLGGAVSRTQRG